MTTTNTQIKIEKRFGNDVHFHSEPPKPRSRLLAVAYGINGKSKQFRRPLQHLRLCGQHHQIVRATQIMATFLLLFNGRRAYNLSFIRTLKSWHVKPF